MLKKYLLVALICSAFCSAAQPLTFKFDFGPGKAAKGYQKVDTNTIFSRERGFGFLPGASLKGIDRKGKDALRGDFISGDGAFYFSVVLPQGNYEVTAILGDRQGSSSATIRVENRRLMAGQVNTANGQVMSVNFTAHIRTPLIQGTQDKVRLKPRELAYLHWDDQLTIEFNGKDAKVCGLEIRPASPAIPVVFLAGNSTVVDQAEEPYAAWGQMIPAFFQPGKIAVANYAESGETLKAFRAEKRLYKILSQMKKGDYLFIEFAHNDQKPGGNHLDPFTTYKEMLKYYILEARKKGGIPVLVTSMHRRNFDENNKIINTLGDYPEAVRQTGKEEGVHVIDLNAMSKVLYEAWGPEASLKAFVHYPANTFPGQTQKLEDNTHFTPYGAYELARCVAEGIKSTVPDLGEYLKKDLPSFNPSAPDPYTSWYWPLSGRVSALKPDGN